MLNYAIAAEKPVKRTIGLLAAPDYALFLLLPIIDIAPLSNYIQS